VQTWFCTVDLDVLEFHSFSRLTKFYCPVIYITHITKVASDNNSLLWCLTVSLVYKTRYFSAVGGNFHYFGAQDWPVRWQPLPRRLIYTASRAEPCRAEPDRTELNQAERVTNHIASRADPNWMQCSWQFWTATMSNQVHVFSLMDNVWWRS
jgi:hypothetical protein